jgi:hypothetical protein
MRSSADACRNLSSEQEQLVSHFNKLACICLVHNVLAMLKVLHAGEEAMG